MTSTHLIDELADQRWRGSSSLAKKIEAALRISLASFKYRTFTFQIFDPLPLGRCRPRELLGIDLCLYRPLAQRLDAHAYLRADRLTGRVDRPVLGEVVEHHLHGSGTLLGLVALGHNPHPSQGRKRHQTRDGSYRVDGAPVLSQGQSGGRQVSNLRPL